MNQRRSTLSERYFQHTFPNGLTLLAEKMAGVQSAAMTLLVPAGVATDPVDRCGSANVLSDLVLRGAGDLDHAGGLDCIARGAGLEEHTQPTL